MQTQLVEKPKDDEVRNYGMLIGGEWVDARSGKTFESINPVGSRNVLVQSLTKGCVLPSSPTAFLLP
jgi:hypothetical protein